MPVQIGFTVSAPPFVNDRLVKRVILNWAAGAEGFGKTARTSWAISLSFKNGTGGWAVVDSVAMVLTSCSRKY